MTSSIPKHSVPKWLEGVPAVFAASCISKTVSLLVNFAIIRLLSVEEYGLQAGLYSILSLIALFAGGGMGSSLLVYGSEARNKEQLNSIRCFTLLAGIAFCIPVIIIQLLLSASLFASNPFCRQMLPVLFFWPLLCYLASYFQILIRTEQASTRYSLMMILNACGSAIFSMIGILLGSLYGLITMNGLFLFVQVLIGIALVPQRPDLSAYQNSRLESKLKKELIKFAVQAGLTSILNQIVYLLDLFMITLLIESPAQIAIYKAACLIPNHLNFIPNAFMIALVPRFARRSNDRRWFILHFQRLFVLNLLLQGTIALLLIMLAPWLIRLLWSEAYLAGLECFRILSISYFFLAGFRIFSTNMLSVLKKNGYNLAVSIALGLLNLSLDFWLITTKGILGAALATLFSVMFASAAGAGGLLFQFSVWKKNSSASVCSSARTNVKSA